MAWLTNRGILHCASAGGLHTPNKVAAMRMKRAGYKKGHPDIIIYEPRGQWHGMAVEVKVKSYPKKEQKAWQAALLERRYYSVIVPGRLDYWTAMEWIKHETELYLIGGV